VIKVASPLRPVSRAGNRLAGALDAGSRENDDLCSVTRSTASTLLLGSVVQPGCGQPELATTTASGVTRLARWKYPAISSGVLARPRFRSSSAGIRAGSCQEITYIFAGESSTALRLFTA
jgi:hypothetical protein